MNGKFVNTNKNKIEKFKKTQLKKIIFTFLYLQACSKAEKLVYSDTEKASVLLFQQ